MTETRYSSACRTLTFLRPQCCRYRGYACGSGFCKCSAPQTDHLVRFSLEQSRRHSRTRWWPHELLRSYSDRESTCNAIDIDVVCLIAACVAYNVSLCSLAMLHRDSLLRQMLLQELDRCLRALGLVIFLLLLILVTSHLVVMRCNVSAVWTSRESTAR